MTPARSASTSAASSTIGPRAVLIITWPSEDVWKTVWMTVWMGVWGVSGWAPVAP
jgi:hypothetical protein